MDSSRREFMRRIGIALGSTLVVRCGTCYAPAPPPTPTPIPTTGDPLWSALWQCWHDLQDQRLQLTAGDGLARELRERQTAALADLVSRGDLQPDVAQDMGVAFEEALAHVQRQSVSCYIALPPEFVPRDDMLSQLEVLEQMAVESEIDPATVAQVRAALEQDIAWLAEFKAGQTPDSSGGVEVSWTSMEAARILIELLLAGQ